MLFYRCLFYGLAGVALLQSLFYYPQLPVEVASHFDGAGAANDWSSRTTFFAIYLVMIALLILVFDLVPGWSGRRGRIRMNIPNREYWLAPERSAETLAWFRRQIIVLGIVHQLLAIYAVQLAIIANLKQAGLDPSIYWALGLYCLFLAGWLLHIFLHFRKPCDPGTSFTSSPVTQRARSAT